MAEALEALTIDAADDSFEGREEYKAVVLLSALEEFYEVSKDGMPVYPTAAVQPVRVGTQGYARRTDTVDLQTTVGMAACEGFGDLEQPGIPAKLTTIGKDHMINTTNPFHLITLASGA